MQIQWFPGHMHKARVQIRETLPKVDLLLEVLDARIPFSSENPMLAEIRGDKPCLKLMAKSDLADPELTTVWKKYLERSNGVRAEPITTSKKNTIHRLTEVIVGMLPERKSEKPISTMIVGIPNVGKSTLINILAKRKIAKTGNEPAVTKGQQRIKIDDAITLFDTPGVLWPNVENKNSGLRLAATGAVKDTAMDYADVAFFAIGYLRLQYPAAIADRYEIETLPDDTIELMDLIGKKKGCLRKGGIVDYDKVSRIFLSEMRSGMLGPLTLETPEMVEKEIVETAKLVAEKAEKKRKRDAGRKAAFKEKKGRERRERKGSRKKRR